MEGRGEQQGIARLDTIPSQSEVEPSDDDVDEIMRQLPANHPLTRLQPRLSSSPLVDIPSPTPEKETRPSSASSEMSFKVPFGKTSNTRSAKELFQQVKTPAPPATPPKAKTPPTPPPWEAPQPAFPDDPAPLRRSSSRDFTGSRWEMGFAANRVRAESKSPERSVRERERERRSREMGRGPNPINRTQSAAQVAPAPRSLSSAAPESRIRSASVVPQPARPSSALGSQAGALYRAPSYKLIGGRMVESMFQDRTRAEDPIVWSGGSAAEQVPPVNILQSNYLITTKDGRRQTLAEYEKSLIQDYKRRSQQNLNLA